MLKPACWILATVLLVSPATPGQPAKPLFDPDPMHLWNRLFAALFVRTTTDGREFGHDEPDPLFWYSTKYLLSGDSHQRALKILDEFLAGGEKAVTDPLKRAFLQRQLWGIFDWSTARETSVERQSLQTRLARALRRLALPEEQIRALPDNYTLSVRTGAFPALFDPDRPDAPFLPADLFDPTGPWIAIRRANDSGPAAGSHVWNFSGHSVFLACMRLPGGRQATLDYLERFRAATSLQFPAGTQVALVRQAVLIDANGGLVPAPLTENIQIRVYRSITSTRSSGVSQEIADEARAAQAVFEFKVKWRDVFAGQGGLRPVETGEKEFPLFSSHGVDPFERREPQLERHLRPVLRSCAQCHWDGGIDSVLTRGFFSTGGPRALEATNPGLERQATVAWKRGQYNWGLLQGLWLAGTR